MKPYFGQGDVLEETPAGIDPDIYMCQTENVIDGPLEVDFLNNERWKILGYQNIKQFYDIVKDFDCGLEFNLGF